MEKQSLEWLVFWVSRYLFDQWHDLFFGHTDMEFGLDLNPAARCKKIKGVLVTGSCDDIIIIRETGWYNVVATSTPVALPGFECNPFYVSPADEKDDYSGYIEGVLHTLAKHNRRVKKHNQVMRPSLCRRMEKRPYSGRFNLRF